MQKFIAQSISAFNLRLLQECITLLRHIEYHDLQLYDIIAYLEESKIAQSKILELPARKITIPKEVPKCPKCSNTLNLREATDTNFESIFYCWCGYEYYTDVSVLDQQMLLQAKIEHKTPDFSVDDLRASKKQRQKRRTICKTCPQLTPQNTCKACGCRMKHRTYYEILTCPKKFW